MNAVLTLAEAARDAALTLNTITEDQKNAALFMISREIDASREEIYDANRVDLHNGEKKGLSDAFLERLTLNDSRIRSILDGIDEVIALKSPVGEVIDQWTRPSGLVIRKRRVPLGVVAIIYESRPNVTVDSVALCVKSGNSVILRGGSDAIHSNMALMSVIRRALLRAGMPEGTAALLADTSREAEEALMKLNGYVDVLIPRGGKNLIDFVVKTASVPVIQTGDGVCHVYVDGEADLEMALSIAVSAKVSRPAVCNSAETLLVDREIASRFLPACLKKLREAGVEVRGCRETMRYGEFVVEASEEDWDAEYNDLIYSVKVVGGLEEAIRHINRHGTRHSEAIVTGSAERGGRFQAAVDAAAVYVNASTRYTDGGEFGLGAEIGISNQKLHARGPMGLFELTTYKYEIDGNGQVR